MTNEGKRNQSKIEFDNAYFAIDNDVERLISNNFGLHGKKLEKHADYLKRKAPLLETLSQQLFIHLKFANGLYPSCQAELEERRMHQKYAAGACYGIAALYEQIFNHTGASAEKHKEELRHVEKELHSIKAWRDSDNKRFKF